MKSANNRMHSDSKKRRSYRRFAFSAGDAGYITVKD